MQGDKWVYAHQSRSTVYTSNRVPRSLFKTAWLSLMFQLSNMQRVLACWWWSSTCMSSLEHMPCQGGFFSACRCLLTRCLRLLPVGPMYTLEHSTQGMVHTTPLCSLTGTGSFRRTSIWWRVHRGRNTTLTPRGLGHVGLPQTAH